DPYRWIPEAARLLRPGGRLVFLRNSTLVILCSDDEWPAKEHLVHPQFGMRRFEFPEGGVEFHLPHGEWIELLRTNGFEIERLIERAAGKARSVEPDERPVLGVDTEVLFDGELLGKPANEAEAEAMIELLAGKTHAVVSGLCLRTQAWEELHEETTLVTFRELT